MVHVFAGREPVLREMSGSCVPLDPAVTGLYEVEILKTGGEGRRRVYRRWVAERQLWMTNEGDLTPYTAAAHGWRLIRCAQA